MEQGQSQDEICVLCGVGFPAQEGQPVNEGTACASCAAVRGGHARNKLLPVALFALLAAAVPVCFSYATSSDTNNYSSRTTVSTRILIFSSSSSNMFDASAAGGDPGPMVHKYSDPIAVAFGGLALVLGLYAGFLAVRSKNSVSIAGAVIAAGLGISALLRGLGHG